MGKQTKDSFDPKLFLAKVGAGKTILEFHTNQSIFTQGDIADTVLYIQKGRVKLAVMSEQGKEAVVAILESGQFFGEGCLNGHPRRLAATTAMEECLITSITKEAMISLLQAEPKFSEMFMAYLLARNIRIEEDLASENDSDSHSRDQGLMNSPARCANAATLRSRGNSEPQRGHGESWFDLPILRICDQQ
jgi:CRP/FNR family cyclic AMP-dependent transcriptional regulator